MCASLQGLPKHQPPLPSPIFSHRFLSKSPLFSPGGCFCDVLLPCPGMWHPPAPTASKEGQGTGTWPRQGCSKGLSCFQKADFHGAKRIEHTSDEKKVSFPLSAALDPLRRHIHSSHTITRTQTWVSSRTKFLPDYYRSQEFQKKLDLFFNDTVTEKHS